MVGGVALGITGRVGEGERRATAVGARVARASGEDEEGRGGGAEQQEEEEDGGQDEEEVDFVVSEWQGRAKATAAVTRCATLGLGRCRVHARLVWYVLLEKDRRQSKRMSPTTPVAPDRAQLRAT